MDITLTSITKHYGPVQALAGIDLKIQSGEFFTLLGPSGCGKTTILRILAGLEKTDTGEVRLGETDITHMPARKRPINTVFQSYALFSHMTVLENVCFGLISRKVPKAEALERAKKMLDRVQLTKMADRKTHQMSGGQQQRVALARALVNEPEVLLLDEPMSALDAKLRLEVQLELRQLQQRLEKTFVMVTHDQHEAITVSDRMAVMVEAQVSQMGEAREIYTRPRSRFVADFLGMENIFEARRKDDDLAETPHGILRVEQRMPLIPCALGIRPENIELSRDPKPGYVPGTVQAVVFQGSCQSVILESGLKARAPLNLPLQAGDTVFVHFPKESLVVLYED